MNGFEIFLQSIEERAKKNSAITDIDYLGEDGLYYCGNCHTKKQCVVKLPVSFNPIVYKDATVSCQCECQAAKEREEEEARQKFEQEERIRRLRNIGMPEKSMHQWTFDNDDRSNPQLSNAMQRFVDNFETFRKDGKGLLLFGTVGTGKTYLAACVANALIDNGISCKVTNFARIANEVQGLFEGKQEYYDELNRYSLLVIDDLSAERKTEYMQEIVFNVVDSRFRAKMPLIVTTNLTREELMHPSDLTYQRIFSRLFEMCTPIEVSGKDRRQQALRENIGKYKGLLGL